MDPLIQQPSWLLQEQSGNPNLLSDLIPELGAEIYQRKIDLDRVMNIKFTKEEFEHLLKTRIEVTATNVTEIGGTVYTNKRYFPRKNGTGMVDLQETIVAEFRGHITYDYAGSETTFQGIVDRLTERFSLHSFQILLDVKSVFFLFRKRAEKAGVANAGKLARERTLKYVDDMLKENGEVSFRIMFPRIYLQASAEGLELEDLDTTASPRVITMQELYDIKSECYKLRNRIALAIATLH